MKTEKNSINAVPKSEGRSATGKKCEEKEQEMRRKKTAGAGIVGGDACGDGAIAGEKCADGVRSAGKGGKDSRSETGTGTGAGGWCVEVGLRYVLPFVYPLIAAGGRKNTEKTVSALRQRTETHLAERLQTSGRYLLQRRWTDAQKEDAEWFGVSATEAYALTEVAMEPDRDGQQTDGSATVDNQTVTERMAAAIQTVKGRVIVRIRLEGSCVPPPQRLRDFLGEELLQLLQTEGRQWLKEELTSAAAAFDRDGTDAVCSAWAASEWMPNFEVFFYGDTDADERMFERAHEEAFAVCRTLMEVCLEQFDY